MSESLLNLLPATAILWPLALLLACSFPRVGQSLSPWLVTAPIPAMLAAVSCVGRTNALLPSSGMPFSIEVDTVGAVLLGVSAILWAAAAIDLPRRLSGHAHRRRFTVCWLLTLTGNMGVFLATDLKGFLVFYALVSLPAYGLAIHNESPEAKRAANYYLAFALLGEALLLIGFVLLALNPAGGGFSITEAVASLSQSPWNTPTIFLLVAGFGLKIGLVPAHGWLPLAHTVAPTPASAVLSGAMLNAGVIGLIRFLPLHSEMPGGLWLAALGFLSAFFGVAVGLTQSNPKTILAYSSVSQMGFIAAVFGIGMIHADATILMPVAFYAAHHTLVKGGVFLAYGCAETRGNGRLQMWAWPALVIGIGLAGLPFTGGALAKLAVKDGFGYGLAASLATASSAATACLMMHFFCRLTSIRAPSEQSVRTWTPMVAWLIMAVAAVAIPWLLHPLVETIKIHGAFSPSELWKATWPIVLGALLGWGIGRRSVQQPSIPAGDIMAFIPFLHGPARAVGNRIESLDRNLRNWSVGAAILVGLVTILALLLNY